MAFAQARFFKRAWLDFGNKERRYRRLNAKAQGRREKNEKDSVVVCRGMSILAPGAPPTAALP